VKYRIFGTPMRTWSQHMPKVMKLKSEGFASSLYDPASSFTLSHYCQQKKLPYADLGLPVPLETFIAYGIEFQKRFVPELENKQVVSVDRSGQGFELVTDDGEKFTARRVVLAVGLSYYDYLPPTLTGLPEELLTHSCKHSSLDCFAGKEVAIVGAGASALDIAAILHQLGAKPQLISRSPKIRFHDPSVYPRPLKRRLRSPITGIGEGWKLVFVSNAPQAFRMLPEPRRLKIVSSYLGPAPGWFIKEQVVGKVPFNLGMEVTAAQPQNGRISLRLSDTNGNQKSLEADHVIAATGYRVDVDKLTLLSPVLKQRLRKTAQSPLLSPNFESSETGLYFAGINAANTFGPLLRFAFGAKFAADRISSHLARTAAKVAA
jgi:cation diffusion facilitator CzcD-associated flavoprotein CzcO